MVDTPAGIQNLSVEQVVQAQEADESLAKIRELAETGERMLTRGRNEYQFLKDGGVLYRKCDQPKGAKGRTFEVGEKALVSLPTDRNKLLLQWRGPYEITRVISGQDYGVSVDGREKIFHPNLLKRYVTRGEASVGPQNHKSRLDMQQAESAGAAVIEPVRNIDGRLMMRNCWTSCPRQQGERRVKTSG